jgi:uncharacterized protein YbaR (Trm112 family)
MKLSLSEEILAKLVCPTTRQPLRLATVEELAGWTAPEPFEGALVTIDGSRAYPVRGGFPVLVAGEALAKVTAGPS